MSQTSAEQGARAAARRVELVQTLAPDRRCAICGRRVRAWASLEVDHVGGRAWSPRKLNRWARVARYWREYREGVRLRAAHRSCNAGYRPPRILYGKRALRAVLRKESP